MTTTEDKNITGDEKPVVASPPSTSVDATVEPAQAVVANKENATTTTPNTTPASSTRTSSDRPTAVAATATTTTTSTPTTASKPVVQMNKEPKIVERQQVELLSAFPENKEDNLTYNFADMTAFDITPIKLDINRKNVWVWKMNLCLSCLSGMTVKSVMHVTHELRFSVMQKRSLSCGIGNT